MGLYIGGRGIILLVNVSTIENLQPSVTSKRKSVVKLSFPPLHFIEFIVRKGECNATLKVFNPVSNTAVTYALQVQLNTRLIAVLCSKAYETVANCNRKLSWRGQNNITLYEYE